MRNLFSKANLSLSNKPVTKETPKLKQFHFPVNKRSIDATLNYKNTEEEIESQKYSIRMVTGASENSSRVPVALRNTDYIKSLLVKETTSVKSRSKSKKKVINVHHNFNHNINININSQKKENPVAKPLVLTLKKQHLVKEQKREVKLTKQALMKVIKKVKHNRLVSDTVKVESKKSADKGSFSLISEDSLFKRGSKKRDSSSKHRSRSFKLSESSEDKFKLERRNNKEVSLSISDDESYLVIRK